MPLDVSIMPMTMSGKSGAVPTRYSCPTIVIICRSVTTPLTLIPTDALRSARRTGSTSGAGSWSREPGIADSWCLLPQQAAEETPSEPPGGSRQEC